MVDSHSKKGVLLFIVLMTIMIVIILGNIILSIMLSQGRLTTHQLSRIQAHYAAMAGITYAYEMLRLGSAAGGWDPPAAGCDSKPPLIDSDFPQSINNQRVSIWVAAPNGNCPSAATQACNPPGGSTACIYAQANYVYTP
jgi:Tfp pilus assembly protein PilX